MRTNLLTGLPWISVFGVDGVTDMDIRDALVHGHSHHSVRCGMATTDATVMRLLAAVLLDAYRKHPDEWTRFHTTKQTNPNIIDAYVNEYQHLFDLTSQKHPFYQHRELADLPLMSISNLDCRISKGSNRLFFDHTRDSDTVRFTSKQVAQGLITTMATSVGGRAVRGHHMSTTYSGAATTHCSAVTYIASTGTITGDLAAHLRDLPPVDDFPAWRAEVPFLERKRRDITGPCDWLTWPTRRIWLAPPVNGLFEQTYISHGDTAGHPPQPAHDPFAAFDTKTGFPSKTRGSVFAMQDTALAFNGHVTPPPSLIDHAKRTGKPVLVRVMGQYTDQGKYLGHLDDTFRFDHQAPYDAVMKAVAWAAKQVKTEPGLTIEGLCRQVAATSRTHPVNTDLVLRAMERLHVSPALRSAYRKKFSSPVAPPQAPPAPSTPPPAPTLF